MSSSQPPSPGGAPVETLQGDLISYYWEGSLEGQGGVCRQAALTHRAERLLDMRVPLGLHLSEDMASALRGCFQVDPSPAQDICPELVRALEFLELISVNLLLFPWRKEIRSLKTYTGSFTYWVRPVLSELALKTILGRLGYVATSKAEFVLVLPINEEDIKQMLFEIFLARVACEATIRATGGQVWGLDRERLARHLCRRGTGQRLEGTCRHLRGAKPGPWGEAGLGRALARATQRQHILPELLPLPEASAAPYRSYNNPPGPWGHLCWASTGSDSEEFLTCYSDLTMHQTPLFPMDLPLYSLQGSLFQGPPPTPRPSGWRQPLVTVPSQLGLTPGPQMPGEQQWANPGTEDIRPSMLRWLSSLSVSPTSLDPQL